MRTIQTLTAVALSLPLIAVAQPKLVGTNYEAYYQWFHSESQVNLLYQNQAQLIIFERDVEVRDEPNQVGQTVAVLNIGQTVTNIAYSAQDDLPEDEINGYGDIWYHVKGTDDCGSDFVGFVWGGHIAKGWLETDLTQDGHQEIVLLGISSKARKTFTDIKGELRVVRSNTLLMQQEVPGLCLFEDCASSPLLRIASSKTNKEPIIIETSTITLGCTAGIEKVFFHWNNHTLEPVYHAEYVSGKEFLRNEFTHTTDQKVELCSYSHEDETYNPVWKCKKIEPNNADIIAMKQSKP